MISLYDSINLVRRLEKELCIFNLEPSDPTADQLASLFKDQNVTIRTERTNSGDPTVGVLSNQDNVLATTDITTLRALTGRGAVETVATGFVDGTYKDILTHLKETTFTSYDTEQLIYASREIEDRARRVGNGTIQAGFQRVSVIDDQQHIYTDLAERGLTVHAYGLPDSSTPDIAPGVIHPIDTQEVADMWFVIFNGADGSEQDCALVAKERRSDDFYGMWTYDTVVVDQLCEYLDQTYLNGSAR